MTFHFLLIFTLLLGFAAGSHGALSEELYWKSVFPNDLMPKALKNILPPADRKMRPSVDWAKGIDGSNSMFNGDCFLCFENYFYGDSDSNKELKGGNPFKGNKKLSDINQTIYFLEKDLHAGRKVKLPQLIRPSSKTTFLTHRVVKSMPFSSDKLPDILKQYSLKAESREANIINETIRNCERPSLDGEETYCATSLESFVDLSILKLGKNIQLLSNKLGKEMENPLFTIGSGVQNMGEKELVCHKLNYPYAVYFCHSIEKTVVYKVPLVGKGGTKANALAVCHKDTSSWGPNHISFQILKIKPGTVPVCHFLLRDALVWVYD